MLFPFSRLGDSELVARFVLSKRRFRSSDQYVKPEAFMPHPHTDLSVTRHKGISVEKIWKHGKAVAREKAASEKRDVPLIGRADLRVSDVRKQSIQAIPDPIWKNWNHANLIGWPSDKPQQKIIALEIAAEAQYVVFEE